MAYGYLLAPSFQFVNINGRPLVGGHIEVFIHNTDTKYITKADFDGTDNPFKVPLNSKGMAVIIASGDFTYDVFCYDRFGSPFWSGSDVAIDNSIGLVIEGAELPMRIVGGKITNNGKELTCTGENAWAEGAETTASGANAHAEGGQTTASGEHSHSEGFRTTASSGYSHAEGAGTKASNTASHAEGQDTTASGQASHAEGRGSVASGNYSHASGRGTRATNEGSHAVGRWNDDGDAFFVVGDGTNDNQRHDAFKVDRNGDTWVSINGTLTKVTNVSGGGGGDQFVLVRSDMTTDFTNSEYQDCVDAVTAKKAVCVQFVQTGTTMQAQLTMITGSGTLEFEFTAENNHYRWEVAATNNAHSIELIGNIFGVPIFDTLQDAITSEYTLKSGDIFETNGFHTSGDGGAARYRVSSTGTANGMDIVQLAAGKLAVLQIENDELYPEQVGCVAEDSSFDCATIFNYIWTICHTIKLHAKRYWFNGYLTPPIASKIIGDVIYSTDQFTQLSELATKRSGDYFIYLEHKEVIIENVMVTNRSNNGGFPDVSTGGVGIRCNDWGGDTSHFGYTLKHLRVQGFRKGIEFQGSVKWNVNLDDIRVTQCYIGIEFGESTFATRFERIHTDRCVYRGINIHGEANIGFYDCNFGSVNTAIGIELYAMSNYHNAQLNFYNCNFECDDQTITNKRSIYFDIDDGVDSVINLSGCRFIQNAATNTQSNRCIGLGKNTILNMLGCELRDNTGGVYDTSLFWDESRPPLFKFGSIKFISSNVGIPRPSFTESKYDKCVVSTDDDTLEMVAIGGGGVIGHNLYDNSSPIILAGYVSEPSTSHPTGLFTLNNSTQVSLAIPITSYMEGKTIRLSALSTSHNRWKVGKHSSLPVSNYTDITYLANSFTTDSGRDYVDIQISVGEAGGYILFFFGSGITTTDFTDSVMACESPYYTPYESYSGGTTTYIVQLKTPLINLDELVSALNLRGNSLV